MTDLTGLVAAVCASTAYTTSATYNQLATLEPNGGVQLCKKSGPATTDPCRLGNAGEGTPTLAPGQQVTVGPFRCQVLQTGVQCTVFPSGKGFFMTLHRAIRIGGATIYAPPLRLTEFRSPDRRVGCLIFQAVPPSYEAFCQGLSGPPREGIILKGKVSVCNTARMGRFCSLGFPTGPVLRYGQQTEPYGSGFLCTSEKNGITCIIAAGKRKGVGFRINQHAAVRVG